MPEPTINTKKKNKTIIILLIVIAILALAFLALRLWQKAKDKKALEAQKDATLNVGSNTQQTNPAYTPPPTPAVTTYTVSTPYSSGTNDNFPLKEGSSGKMVQYVQAAINKIVKNPYLKVPEDGNFSHQVYLNLITGVGTRFYPVTKDNYMELLQKAAK